MNGCRYEPEVLRAVEDDSWTDALRAHVGACDECSAATHAGSWMRSFAAFDDREHILPNPSIVYLKAQLLQQTRTLDRATRPMSIAQTSAYVFIATCWAALLSANWDTVMSWLHTLTPKGFVTTATGSAAMAQLSMTFFIVAALLASATAMLAFHTILAED